MGKPKFGNFDRKKIEVNKAVRSESNFHDSHHHITLIRYWNRNNSKTRLWLEYD